MARLTNFAENKILNHILGIASWTMPAAVSMALFTSDPGETGSLAGEVAGGNYARLQITAKLGTATNGFLNNLSDIVFNQASAAWGTIAYVGIMPSTGGSEMLMYAPLPTPIYINTGDVFRFNANNMTAYAD